MKAIITKYALTSGPRIIEGEIDTDDMTMFNEDAPGGTYRRYFHGNDWHRTIMDAIEQVTIMENRKRTNIERQLAKLSKKACKAREAIAEMKF